MPASARCAAPGCPVIVESRPNRDTLFCSEMHMALYQISELQSAIVSLARDAAHEVEFEHLTLTDVTGRLPIERSGALDGGRTGKVW